MKDDLQPFRIEEEFAADRRIAVNRCLERSRCCTSVKQARRRH